MGKMVARQRGIDQRPVVVRTAPERILGWRREQERIDWWRGAKRTGASKADIGRMIDSSDDPGVRLWWKAVSLVGFDLEAGAAGSA